MEHLRGDVKQDTSVETTLIEHFFSGGELESEWNEKFTVDSEVAKIGVYFKTDFLLSDVRNLFPEIFDIREVEVTITDATGKVQYNATHDTTKTAPYVLIDPETDGKFVSGEWNINIVGTGAGFIEEQDSFILSVDVTRTCTIYPQDDVCIVD